MNLWILSFQPIIPETHTQQVKREMATGVSDLHQLLCLAPAGLPSDGRRINDKQA